LPKAPVIAREVVGAAKTFHEGKHHAKAGKDAEAGGGEDDRAGIDAAGEDVGLEQVHCVRGQKLIESGAEPACEVCSFGHSSDECGENEGGGKEHEHAGIGDSLGRVDDVVSEGEAEGFAEI